MNQKGQAVIQMVEEATTRAGKGLIAMSRRWRQDSQCCLILCPILRYKDVIKINSNLKFLVLEIIFQITSLITFLIENLVQEHDKVQYICKNLVEYKLIGTHWVAINVTDSGSFRTEYFSKWIKKFIGKKISQEVFIKYKTMIQ